MTVTLALPVLLLAGCGAGDGVSEDEFSHGADGVYADVGEVLLRDVSIDEPPDTQYEPGDVARLRVTLVNEAERADALVAVQTPAASAVRMLVDRDCDGDLDQLGEVPLAPQPLVRRPKAQAPDGPDVHYRVDLVMSRPLRAGSFVPVTFRFRNAGSTTVQVPVELTDLPLHEDDADCEPADAVVRAQA